jgi:hypothetical protein
MHNNFYRNAVHGRDVIPTMAYGIFRKGFEEPKLSEGFEEIKVWVIGLNGIAD